MVGVERFELPTSCSQSRRATGLRYTPKRRGKFIFRKAFQTVIILNAVLQSNSQLKITGAERGTRTPTTSRSSDFESDVSTNFTTSAEWLHYIHTHN